MAAIGPEDDDKLNSLRRFLGRSDVKNGKVLIFSEAETTVEYLYRELARDDDKGEIARLTGSNRDSAEEHSQTVRANLESWLNRADARRGGSDSAGY